MHVLPRTYFGNPILRKEAKNLSRSRIVSKEIQELIRAMFYTMHRVRGIGLAAPQINYSIKLTVLGLRPTKFHPDLKRVDPAVIINPTILHYGKKSSYDWEGCLSFPDARGLVPRPTSVDVQYTDECGKVVRRTITGYAARVFQHEIDHLYGTLYIDRMEDMRTPMTLEEFERRVLGQKG